ncbi:agmatinase family protein [Vulcanisaeta distributa]|uniref:Arginase/agmatinase/formiminoglutamase n=1 Tax=Vulcanisaeta distributa (strain DSM 14429 / JCM 11212 / NBRC 100878 / IC-017) TaxID=572478 RepID=E1QNL7_VULDI|nr:agmatinase family protein [Vulcanisaeta distributa]ADN51305.1 Arginase/agmatinase/formiminoglutamase [Vulcanisaeta distributa DSM 14429]
MSNNIDFYVVPQYTLFGVPKCGRGIPILGIPMEDTVSFRPGTRFAPSVIRTWSQYFEFTPTEDLGIDPLEKACDLGDLSLMQGMADKNLERINLVVKDAINTWGRVVNIGGEHTLSLGVARAVRESQGSYGIYIHVDAHLDSREEWPLGQSLSHATFVRHIINQVRPQSLVFLGFRSYDKEEINFVRGLENSTLLSTRDIRSMDYHELRLLIRGVIDSYPGPIHLSIDVDVLDPSIMPGVGNPEGFGLNYGELLRIIKAVLDYGGSRVKAVDLVEYSPPNDPGLMSLPTIIKLILDVLNYL